MGMAGGRGEGGGSLDEEGCGRTAGKSSTTLPGHKCQVG